MKSLLISMVFFCLIISATQVQAQTWSPAEKEVVQAIEDCYRAYREENLEAVLACHHDDYVGFYYGSPHTTNKAEARKEIALFWANNNIAESWNKPLAIRIVGNVAIIHKYAYVLIRDKDGKETQNWFRWTDVMVKQGGKWVWIAGHGGPDPGVKPSGN